MKRLNKNKESMMIHCQKAPLLSIIINERMSWAPPVIALDESKDKS
jgi:hypothetical protein